MMSFQWWIRRWKLLLLPRLAWLSHRHRPAKAGPKAPSRIGKRRPVPIGSSAAQGLGTAGENREYIVREAEGRVELSLEGLLRYEPLFEKVASH